MTSFVLCRCAPLFRVRRVSTELSVTRTSCSLPTCCQRVCGSPCWGCGTCWRGQLRSSALPGTGRQQGVWGSQRTSVCVYSSASNSAGPSSKSRSANRARLVRAELKGQRTQRVQKPLLSARLSVTTVVEVCCLLLLRLLGLPSLEVVSRQTLVRCVKTAQTLGPSSQLATGTACTVAWLTCASP